MYGDWNGTCDGCRVSATTSIGQQADSKNCGDFFGPVGWSGEIIYGSDATLQPFAQWLDYPGWTHTPNNECGNTPASPLNSVIEVSNQSLSAQGGKEAVIINDGSGTWLH